MPRRANPMAVKANVTYDVFEAARALKVTPATIRNWIKDGLKAMTSQKPFLMLGAAIREYLRAKYKAAKRPLEPDQLYCPRCKTGRAPLGMMATQSKMTAQTDLLTGPCGICGATSTRIISHDQRVRFAATFRITKSGDSEA